MVLIKLFMAPAPKISVLEITEIFFKHRAMWLKLLQIWRERVRRNGILAMQTKKGVVHMDFTRCVLCRNFLSSLLCWCFFVERVFLILSCNLDWQMLTAQVYSIMPGRSLPSYTLFFSIHLDVQYFFLDTILCIRVCVSVNVCHLCASAQADLNRASNPPKLEEHVAMSHLTWLLGTEFRSSGRAGSILTSRASPKKFSIIKLIAVFST